MGVIPGQLNPSAGGWWAALGSVTVVFGFPVFISLALQTVPASHGAVVVGLLPAATAVAAVLLARERPRPLFWAVCGLGLLAVPGFGLMLGAGQLGCGDLHLLLAVLLAALGYAEGGRLARGELGAGRRAACGDHSYHPHAPPAQMPSPAAWLAFGYVCVFNMLLGFFAWSRGLALGGIARAGQAQPVQPGSCRWPGRRCCWASRSRSRP